MTQGQQTPSSGNSEFNAMTFLAEQILAKANFATLVKVIACTNAGGLEQVGFVDVEILVNQVDGSGQPVPHVTVYGLPYFRLQGGANAVIIDPELGDIGIAVFAHSDISSVKANRAQANPGSARRNNIADGMYFGGALNAAPTQFVQFNGDGITVTSPVAITVNGPAVTINCETATLNASGSVAINTPQLTVN